MQKISRGEFLKTSVLGIAASVVPVEIFPIKEQEDDGDDKEFMNRLLKYNDLAVSKILGLDDENEQWGIFGRISVDFSILVASYCQSGSKHYRSSSVLNKMDKIITHYLSIQYPNGTIDAGGNRQSPPDTGFLLRHLCPSWNVLSQHEFDELKVLKEKLKRFMLNIGDALVNGGVHTPNHRWEVSSGLVGLYSIFKEVRFLKRAEEWLAEGFYIDEDGQYSERSRIYSQVVNFSLLNIGRMLNRPSYFDIVKRNLVSTYYYMETNGELVTLDSRRQDQYAQISITGYYMFYRFLAILDNDQFLASVAREIETFHGFDHNVLSQSLIFVMNNPMLGNKLPEGTKLPTDYAKLYSMSGLARIRRENITSSIFGGNDKPLIISSGRSCIPTFFTYRKGEAILEYARLSTNFFNMGYFRSDGVKKDGNKYTLSEEKEAYYYQPMPPDKINKDGDYKLSESVDRRFWGKMDYESRPRTTLSQETKIVVEENNGAFKMDIEVAGPKNVEVTLEFCFRYGGTLKGVSPANGKDDYLLKSGNMKYLFGNDIIEIGPGIAEFDRISFIDGEVYSSHFGTIKGKGMHIYITGFVPFKHSLTIK